MRSSLVQASRATARAALACRNPGAPRFLATVASDVTSASSSAPARPISSPTLANIEERWDQMAPQEQADIWMQLRDRMKVDWNELTLQEKKAAYWIAFGPHGPRADTPPGEAKRVILYTIYGVLASGAIFAAIRAFGSSPPHTMSKEYQEKSNEFFQDQKIEPITGAGAPGYSGPGNIQSK